MSREILFRGKTEQGEWVYGYLLGEAIIPFDTQATPTSLGMVIHGGEAVIPSTIGQYTGLTDKNGTRIFEGDILHFTNVFKSERRLPILWEKEYAGWSCGVFPVGEIRESCEVIGNIHDKEVE